MALRTRLFLFFGTLIAVLVSAELWLVQTLTRDLEDEVGELALEMGNGFLHFLGAEEPNANFPATLGFDVAAGLHAPPARIRHERAQAGGAFVLRMREQEVLTEGGNVVMVVDSGDVFSLDLKGTAASELDMEALHRELIRYRHPVHQKLIRRVVDGDPRINVRRIVNEHGISTTHAELFEHLGDEDLAVQIAVSGDLLFGDDEEVFLEMKMTPAAGHWVAAAPSIDVEEELYEFEVEDTPLATEQPVASARIPIPRQGLVTAVESFLSRLLLGSAGILIMGLLVAGYTAHRVSEPLQGLARAARRVGDGDFGAQVASEGDREVRDTISAFNTMSTQLAELDDEARSLREREHLFEMGEVARGLAHSLRNPLNVLGLTVDQLAGDEQPGLAVSARAQIQRIDRTLRTFLSLSSGGGEPEIVAVDDIARDVALELVQDCSARARVRVEADGPVPLCAVGPELRAVLHVLVVNAAEASPEDSEVVVRVAPTAGGARIEVLDRGTGVAASVRNRLFTPHTTTKEQGAGMGLYLAQRIARNRYAGSLALEERTGGGTAATLVVRSLGEGACG